MTDAPKMMIRPGRGEAKKEFTFNAADLPLDGLSNALTQYRQHAWESANALPFPTTSEEAWRRTDISALAPQKLMIKSAEILGAVPKALLSPIASEEHSGQIILRPNGNTISLDAELKKKGVIFTDFLTAERNHPDLVAKWIGKAVRTDEGKFAGMAGALATTGVFLFVPRGVQLDVPLHSLLWGAGNNLALFSHILVVLEDGASATYVHESASPVLTDGQAMHAGIVELIVGADAKLQFVELQSWGEQIYNFTHERAVIQRGATLDWIFGAIGSRLTKNFTEINLAGEGSTGRMSGFYFADGVQHLDHDTQQNHLAPHTTSDLLFKGALLGSSRSVWQGMIYVAPVAQKTDGYQANRNLVLSDHARADSIPGLEILADDVRCTHGATVGKLDRELVFYLLSRGIPRPLAERLIVEGFFDPIMQRIPFEGVRVRFQKAIQEKMQAFDV